jgi:3-oxoacyl-[acyl-carrier-protein] synthase I
MASSIQIVGVGARTPVGDAAAAAAFVRAGLTAFGEHPFMLDLDGVPTPAAVDEEIDLTDMGPKRLLALAEPALRNACASLDSGAVRQWLPVFLGLPALRPGFTEKYAEAVRTGLARLDGLPADLAEITVFPHGHAAGLSALAAGFEHLHNPAFDVCLVGGVDSYFHADTVEWLNANRQLAGAVSRSGFVPGEGAAFCLLATDKALNRLGLKPTARVRAVAAGKETKLIKTTDMCLGEGLSATVRDAVSSLRLPDERINEIYCDINGERYRSEEWGFVCLRLAQYFDDATAYHSPAECLGDMGAASGPLFAVLACRAFARGYSRGPRVMLWASSEGGQRSVAVLEDSSAGLKEGN